jgi:PAS domain S-box-containing protein
VDAITGRIVLWNWAATRIFGYSPSEALELRIESLIPERLQAEISRYRETGRRVYVDSHGLLELAATRKGGEEIWVEMSLSPIAPVRDLGEADGRFVLAIARDVTERKRAYDRLAEANGALPPCYPTPEPTSTAASTNLATPTSSPATTPSNSPVTHQRTSSSVGR